MLFPQSPRDLGSFLNVFSTGWVIKQVAPTKILFLHVFSKNRSFLVKILLVFEAKWREMYEKNHGLYKNSVKSRSIILKIMFFFLKKKKVAQCFKSLNFEAKL